MPNFELQQIDSIQGKQDFFVMKVDGENQFDEFYESIKTNKQYCSEVKSIQTNMNHIANLGSLPENKFKWLTNAGDPKSIKECEFKTKHLRAYAFHIPSTGKVVAYWGTKANQKNDISEFRRVKKLYFNSLDK